MEDKRFVRDGRNAQSLHQRILGEVQQRILSGEWPPGYRLPIEQELKAHFGCSRMTVNKVLTQLAGVGLIERRRKAGTFVGRPLSQAAVLQIQDMETEIANLGLPYAYKLLRRRRRRATRADAARLDLPVSSPLLELSCRHSAGPRPFCLEERIISLLAVPEAETESFAEIGPGRWLTDHVPWTAAQHTIRAATAHRTVAAALSIPAEAACLVIERRTWKKAQPVTYVRLTYPGDSHELVARFTPSNS